MSDESTTPIFERHYDDGSVRFDLVLEPNLHGLIRFSGKGTVGGAKAFADALIEGMGRVPVGQAIEGLVDLSEVSNSPLRSQFVIGKAMMKIRDRLGRAAVFGAKPVERKLVGAVLTIARIKTVQFCETEDEAKRFLGW